MRTTGPTLSALLLFAAWPHPAATAADFKLNGHLFTLADGFEIELVAAPPLADRPIGVDFDEQGRLYVSDSSGSNDPVQKQIEARPHRILRLEDIDGDGRYDKSVVFADRMMFPEGVLWHEGALLVGAPPSIWKLRDTNGDGVADERTEWFKGEALTGCANDIHGPYLGRDGWIYWTKGGFGKQNIQRPGKPPITDIASHIFRARPDGSGLESFMAGGMDNPVEIIFTPEGDPIFTTTFYAHPESGKRDGLVHAIYGGLYPKPHGVIDGLKRTGDLMPILTHLGPAAPSGLCRYNSQVFGADFQGNLFSTLFNMRKVMRHILRPSGATYASTDSDFLVSDNPDFHPTDVVEDADGSLLVIDTGGWYKLCCPTSQIAKPEVLGAIYRIRRAGAPKVIDPRGLKVAWSTAKPSALAKLLDDPRPFVQQRAVAELARRGEGAVKTLRSAVSSDPTTAVNAAWTLTRIGTPTAIEALKRGLREKDVTVRQAATCGLGLLQKATPQLLQADLARSDAPALRRAAATALGRSLDKSAVPLLLNAAAAPVDRVLEHSLIYALIEINDRDAIRLGIHAANSHSRRAALIALDQMDHSDIRVHEVAPLLAARDATLRDTANWIVRRHPEWGPDLTAFLRQRLTSANLTAEEREELQQQLAGLAQNSAVQAMMGEQLGDDRLARNNRQLLLLAMAQSGLRETPASWETNFAIMLPLMQEGSVRLAVNALRTLPKGKASPPALTTALMRIGSDPARPADLRVEALAAIRESPVLDDSTYNFLRAQIDPAQPPLQRTAAACVLARARLSDTELLRLIDTTRVAGPLELPRLLAAFERTTSETVGTRLVAALRTAPSLSSLRPEQVKPVFAKYPAAVQQQAEALAASLNADADRQKARLDELENGLAAGDRDRGRRIFESAQTACSTCHQVGYLGGRVGPDLSRIGSIRTGRDLLESILYPSTSFVRSYEPMILTTRVGEEHSGVIREESGNLLTLVTGPSSEVRLARSDIREMRPGTVSIMPQGLDEQLSREQLADLVTFLRSLK